MGRQKHHARPSTAVAAGGPQGGRLGNRPPPWRLPFLSTQLVLGLSLFNGSDRVVADYAGEACYNENNTNAVLLTRASYDHHTKNSDQTTSTAFYNTVTCIPCKEFQNAGSAVASGPGASQPSDRLVVSLPSMPKLVAIQDEAFDGFNGKLTMQGE